MSYIKGPKSARLMYSPRSERSVNFRKSRRSTMRSEISMPESPIRESPVEHKERPLLPFA